MTIGRFTEVKVIDGNMFDTEAVRVAFFGTTDKVLFEQLERMMREAVAKAGFEFIGIVPIIKLFREKAMLCAIGEQFDFDEELEVAELDLTDGEWGGFLDVYINDFTDEIYNKLGSRFATEYDD